AGLFEGSALGHVPDSLVKLRAREGWSMYRTTSDDAALAGLLLSPEVLRELGRMRGAAVAVTGMDKEEKGMPEFVAIILPGESNAPSFLMRTFVVATHSSHATVGKANKESV